jgi:hypothetical protein
MPTPAGENSHVNLAAVGFADPSAAFDSIQMAATPGWWPIGNYTETLALYRMRVLGKE